MIDDTDIKDGTCTTNSAEQNSNVVITASNDNMTLNDSGHILLNQNMTNKMDIYNYVDHDEDGRTKHVHGNKNCKIFNVGLLTILAILSGIQNGCLPSISSYSLLSYNNTTYVLASTITTCVSPIAALIPGYFELYCVNHKAINICFTVALIGVAYLLLTASLSPNPIGKGTILFEIIVVAIHVTVCALLAFVKTSCIMYIKRELNQVCVEESPIYCFFY